MDTVTLTKVTRAFLSCAGERVMLSPGVYRVTGHRRVIDEEYTELEGKAWVRERDLLNEDIKDGRFDNNCSNRP